MAFFDDLGKAFNNAGQKTKNMADAAKLNSSISEEERKLNSVYSQIGYLYVQLHAEDYEEPFTDLIRSCTEASQKISDMKKKVRELKNIISCPGCGADMSGDAAFCSLCGYRMPQKEVPAPKVAMKCTACGATIAPGMNFCSACGAPKPQPVPQPQPAPQPVPAVCKSCNAAVEPGSAFCVICGAPVSNPEPMPIAEAPQQIPQPAEVPAQAPIAEPAPEETPAAAGINCPNCGAALDGDSVFCIECGTKVR